jgi:transposase-like protein
MVEPPDGPLCRLSAQGLPQSSLLNFTPVHFSTFPSSTRIDLLSKIEKRTAQLCRRHNISTSLLYHWERQHIRGKFNNEPTEEAALKDRIEKLERLVGRLTLENEFLKKGLRHSLNHSHRSGRSSPDLSLPSGISDGGVD